MGRKRRQRSTTIRKRIEKKQREEARARKRDAKRSGKDQETMVLLVADRGAALTTSDALQDLNTRLGEAPIRGWTPHDLGGDQGLNWLAGAMKEASADGSDPLRVEMSERAKREIGDKLTQLEMAAPGLQIDWDESFNHLVRAVSQAEIIPEEEEEEGAEG